VPKPVQNADMSKTLRHPRGHLGTNAEVSRGQMYRIFTVVPKCPMDTNTLAPVPKCLGSEVS